MKEKLLSINCPHCGTEYRPGEIFVPNYFLGQPTNIERNVAGEIIYEDGIPQDLHESFVCWKCEKEFNVDAEIVFKVSASNKVDMSDCEFVSRKYLGDLYLEEE